MEQYESYRILIVDDEIEYQNVLSVILKSNGFSVLTASGGLEALEKLKENDVSLVLTDLKMPGMDGLTLIRRLKDIDPQIDIIVVTAYGTIDSAVEAVKYGADGYFVKSNDPEILLRDVHRLAKIRKLTTENRILKNQSSSEDYYLKTNNPRFAQILNVCEKAAESSINVLLTGESGTGKEVLAHYIHDHSDRSHEPFIPVNCQAFSEGMIESELFGHEKGAFTGAISQRIGRFEEANHGTIFLDEIGDLPEATQGKLLRTLENHTIERVGSNRTIALDIRLISATNKDLNQEIADKKFREDLFYRINTLTITIPPLRERREDIPDLIDYFIAKIQKEQKKIIHAISPDVIRRLTNYNYPGNIRELKNILERLVVLSENGTICSTATVFPEAVQWHESPKGMNLRDARDLFEQDYIRSALVENNGKIGKTAESLGISTRQLHNLIAKYQIKETD